VHQKPNTSGIKFHSGGGEFCLEGVAFGIFSVKMSNPHPLSDPPTLGVNIERCISHTIPVSEQATILKKI
jgi:hypothetical protein